MNLSAEALEILTYLKTAPGKFFSLSEISRKAAGRRQFQESPDWAKNLMPGLLESGLIQVNPRGHYRVPAPAGQAGPRRPATPTPPKIRGRILGDDYFPAAEQPRIVNGDYFPKGE